MGAVLGTKKCIQICIVVKDVEEKKKKWAEFLGMPVSPTGNGGPYYKTKCVYKGEPAPVANCEMGFYQLTDDISVECLQPVGDAPSDWQDFLDQKGNYADGSGMYAYLDSRDELKATIETLETFRYDD